MRENERVRKREKERKNEREIKREREKEKGVWKKRETERQTKEEREKRKCCFAKVLSLTFSNTCAHEVSKSSQTSIRMLLPFVT